MEPLRAREESEDDIDEEFVVKKNGKSIKGKQRTQRRSTRP